MIRVPAQSPALAVADSPQVFEDGVVLRRVETLVEYQECVAVQEETWGNNFRERVPSAILLVSQRLSGVCAAAFGPEGRLLGFVFGITGPYRGELAHWSDLLAVRVEARGRHIGERLKQYQRRLCQRVGVETIYWTFDPLVARNAHLNLTRLGAKASEYVVNMYGNNTGSPLHGSLDTDRWIVRWDLTSNGPSRTGPNDHGIFVVSPSAGDSIPITAPFVQEPHVRVAVPRDFDRLDASRRASWRESTRAAFLHYLGLGYEVVSFQRALPDRPPFYELAATPRPS